GQLTSYGYDSDQRLSEVELPGSSLRYQYDHQGNRISQTLNGQTTHWLVDANRDHAQVLEEQDATGQTTHYSHGDDLLSQQRGDDVRYFLYDALGSTRGLTDAQGNLTDQYQYDAWGQTRQHDGTSQTAYQFAGEQWDANLGWIYLRARYLDPVTGRFVSRDPHPGNPSNPVSLHDYLYANGDPVSNIDPLGLFSIAELNAGMKEIQTLSANSGRAFVQGNYRMGWQLAKQSGRAAEKWVERIVKECLGPNSIVGRNSLIKSTRREVDMLVKVEKSILELEVKNKIPKNYGEPLRRLREQLMARGNSSSPALVVGGLEVDSLILAEGYLTRAGLSVGGVGSGSTVVLVNGLVELASYFVKTYGAKCLDL
ncbi:RHS repeat-associated core domain-containing protein, partial [Chitinivorax sp. B]|uniref:RHS repeat domain-containing protein n=1 Tax=Chitinivorax sp. B TaxID=2502235 RepID=UPI0010F51F0C